MVQQLVHSISVARRRLVKYVSPEVHLAPLPDQAGEGFPQRLDEPVMRVAGSYLDAREAPALESPDKPAPPFGCLSEGRQKGREFPVVLPH